VATFAGLSRLRGGTIANYTTANGLSSNVITALLSRGDGTLLIGTQDHGGMFGTAKDFHPKSMTVWTRRVSRNSGRWRRASVVCHRQWIARCDCAGAGNAMQGAGCSHWIELAPRTGCAAERQRQQPSSAWRSATTPGVARPKELWKWTRRTFRVNNVPPPVATGTLCRGRSPQALHAADSALRIPAGHVHFQFDYAGLSFYRTTESALSLYAGGLRRDWTDAGARRSAYYTNIPPGRYTFRVQAANNDGLWNTSGAALTFELRPHYYQTAWFLVLCYWRRRVWWCWLLGSGSAGEGEFSRRAG